MSQEGARHRARLWLAQAQDDLRAAKVLQAAGQEAQACWRQTTATCAAIP